MSIGVNVVLMAGFALQSYIFLATLTELQDVYRDLFCCFTVSSLIRHDLYHYFITLLRIIIIYCCNLIYAIINRKLLLLLLYNEVKTRLLLYYIYIWVCINSSYYNDVTTYVGAMYIPTSFTCFRFAAL